MVPSQVILLAADLAAESALRTTTAIDSTTPQETSVSRLAPDFSEVPKSQSASFQTGAAEGTSVPKTICRLPYFRYTPKLKRSSKKRCPETALSIPPRHHHCLHPLLRQWQRSACLVPWIRGSTASCEAMNSSAPSPTSFWD